MVKKYLLVDLVASGDSGNDGESVQSHWQISVTPTFGFAFLLDPSLKLGHKGSDEFVGQLLFFALVVDEDESANACE